MRPLTLALAGGGAKGAAHAGVLSVLEEAGLPVGGIAGVSAGALVAVLYGLGFTPEQICDYLCGTHLFEVWELDPGRRGILGTAKARARLESAVGDKTFADLRLPVAVLAADLERGCVVRLNFGRLADALMAAIAIPVLFAPQPIEGRTLVDGGILEPLPLAAARSLGRPVVAVDVLTAGHEHGREPQIFEARGPMRYATEVTRRLGLLDLAEMFHQSVLIASLRLVDYSLRADPPDVLLRPAVHDVGLFAFDLAPQAFAAGVAAARSALPELCQSAEEEATQTPR